MWLYHRSAGTCHTKHLLHPCQSLHMMQWLRACKKQHGKSSCAMSDSSDMGLKACSWCETTSAWLDQAGSDHGWVGRSWKAIEV